MIDRDDPRASGVKVIAVFGGSFDPPHVAHVLAASYVLATEELDRLMVVPTWQHPLDKRTHADFEDRFRMCQLAMRDLARVEVSRIEQELGGESRTIRTLHELRRRMPGTPLRLIVGSDLLAEVDRWLAFDQITALAPPLVLGRTGFPTGRDLPVEFPPVSSRDIRHRVATGEPTAGLLPRAVADYIEHELLYRKPDEP